LVKKRRNKKTKDHSNKKLGLKQKSTAIKDRSKLITKDHSNKKLGLKPLPAMLSVLSDVN